MPKYKDSPEERAANELMKKQIQEVLTNFNVNDLSDLHKLLLQDGWNDTRKRSRSGT